MRYALVAPDGTVSNVVEWDGKAEWGPPEGVVAVTGEDAQIGDSYDSTIGFSRALPPPSPPEPPRTVRKSLIVQRLHDAGKLAAASAVLNSDIYARERWYAPDQPSVRADNPEVLALLAAVGADPVTILAAE